MINKFKLKLIYLSILAVLPISYNVHAKPSDDPSENLKVTIGNKNNKINNMTVNDDGSIVIGGNKQKDETQQKELVFSGSGDSNIKENKTIENKNKTDTNTADIPKTEEGEFKGGIGTPFYSETGVLVFEGSNKKKKEVEQKNNIENENNFYSEVPHIKLDKIPLDVQNMPIPSSLPPLPSDNGNVMLPISLPTSEAVSLPPLPDFFIPNLGVSMGTMDQDGINNFGIPVNPDGKPINYKGMNSIFTQEKNKALSNEFIDEMRKAGNKFLNLGIPMKVVIVNTDDYELRRFVATNILRSNKNNFESIDTGSTSILSLNTSVNNNQIPICYIVLKNEQQQDLMNKYIYPLRSFTDDKTIAAYLVAHQVSHCMDNLERYKQLPKIGTWFPEDAKKVGLSSSAVKRLYPYGMTYNQYSRTTMHLYDDLGQRQYQERIGDIFGLYLTVFSGYDDKIIDGILRLRQGVLKDSSHNTYDAIKNIRSNYYEADKRNVKTLWQSARSLQVIKDIDPILYLGAPESIYKASLNKNSDKSESSISKEFTEKTKKENKNKTEPVKFNELPKFGTEKNTIKKFGAGTTTTVKE